MKNDYHDDGTVSRAERLKWVKRYRASGLGLKRFAAEHDLKAGQLHSWVYAPDPAPVAEPAAPVFQEVRLAQSVETASPWAAEVALPNGLAVRLRAGTEPGWAGALVVALGELCSR